MKQAFEIEFKIHIYKLPPSFWKIQPIALFMRMFLYFRIVFQYNQINCIIAENILTVKTKTGHKQKSRFSSSVIYPRELVAHLQVKITIPLSSCL